MTDRPQLSALPDPGDQQLFDWLLEPEAVDPRRMLQRVALEIADLRQARRTPWDAAVEAVRPAPFGRPAARAIALLVAAALLLTVAVSMVLVVGGRCRSPHPPRRRRRRPRPQRRLSSFRHSLMSRSSSSPPTTRLS